MLGVPGSSGGSGNPSSGRENSSLKNYEWSLSEIVFGASLGEGR